jgi:hypothetical protein
MFGPPKPEAKTDEERIEPFPGNVLAWRLYQISTGHRKVAGFGLGGFDWIELDTVIFPKFEVELEPWLYMQLRICEDELLTLEAEERDRKDKSRSRGKRGRK